MAVQKLDAFQPVSRAIFRVMLSGIFIVAGSSHLANPARTAGRLETAEMGGLATWMGSAETLVILSGVALLAGGIALLSGFKTRLAALGLLLLLIPITLTVQVGSMSQLGPLFKNIGLAGGLIYFITHGADMLSLDSFFVKKRS